MSDQPSSRRKRSTGDVSADAYDIGQSESIDEQIAARRPATANSATIDRRARPHPMRVIHDQGFGRIVTHIVHFWGKRDLDLYLTQLTISDRPQRQGFPPAVMHALMELLEFHRDVVMPQDVPLLNPFCGGPRQSGSWGEDRRLSREIDKLERARAGLTPEQALDAERRLVSAFLEDESRMRAMGRMIEAHGRRDAPAADSDPEAGSEPDPDDSQAESGKNT
jgi:hypothetical protein